jgi:hypothetical protein
MSTHEDDVFLDSSHLHGDDLVTMDDMLTMGDGAMDDPLTTLDDDPLLGDDPFSAVDDDPLTTMGDGIANRLAFTYDPANLDEDGKPKNKLARK